MIFNVAYALSSHLKTFPAIVCGVVWLWFQNKFLSQRMIHYINRLTVLSFTWNIPGGFYHFPLSQMLVFMELKSKITEQSTSLASSTVHNSHKKDPII